MGIETVTGFKAVVESINDGVIILDKDGRTTYVNPAFEKMTGFTAQESLGRTIRETSPYLTPKAGKIVAERIKKRLLTGEPIANAELEGVNKEGKRLTLSYSASVIKNEKGEIVGEVVAVRDITERKRMEEALRLQAEITVNMAEGVYLIGASDGTIRYANPKFEDMFGYESGEMIGKHVSIVNAPTDKSSEETVEEIERQLKRDGVWHGEVKNIKKDGTPFWCYANVSAFEHHEYGRVYIAVHTDITERKQAEEALQDMFERQHVVFEQAAESIVLFDVGTGELVDFNETTHTNLGYTHEEFARLKLADFEAKESPEERAKHIERFVKQGSGTFETQHRTKSGEIRDVDVSGKIIQIGGKKYAQSIWHDITERKQAEKELKESEQRFRAIFDNATDGILLSNVGTGKFYTGNKMICQMLGYSQEEIGNLGIGDIHPKEDLPYVIEQFEKLSRGELTLARDIPTKRKDGSIFYADISVSSITLAEELYRTSIFRDITERKRVEEELLKNRDLLDETGKMAKVGGWEFDVETLRQTWTEEVYHIHELDTDYQPTVEKGINFYAPEAVPIISKAVQRTIEYGEPYDLELPFITAKGNHLWVHAIGKAYRKDGKTIRVGGTFQDITERKQAEEREKHLQQEISLSGRLASIGELAAGVAHEINNPLTGIVGFSERLLRKSTDEEISRGLGIINSEALRAAKVVESLRAFARPREPKMEELDINDILQRALELRAYELKTDSIEFVTDLVLSLPRTRVDFQQIQQVFLNIILNAEQAMIEVNGRGKLTIKTQQMKDSIRVSFTDDGPGIPAENLDKLFDPFFTTRGEKGGTGLGLSVCHGIVTEHGGRIYARNKPGKGATFFVELPLTSRKETG